MFDFVATEVAVRDIAVSLGWANETAERFAHRHA
jgi:hypothetical protein